ncbi:DNA excision repair protein ERCC-6-like [Cheilinus undulatus]|uniref:DNA excision repair protein ERCC-6-like n=1 Tax=Cheilinus undulatus TaxID=241271 RepID=UPI001BD29008|nr:DNA excision repair protein ERCC-6-like [Cheilinus undulatus]
MDVSQHNGEVSEISKKLEKSLTMDTDDKMEAYQRFIQDGKNVARQGDMYKALGLFKKAYKIHQSEKLENRIKKIEELISQNDSEEEDEEFVDVNNSGLMLFKDLHNKLYDYQRNGVAFLYSLYRDGRKGGILADDMGLGKTIQVISFLSGMYDNELAKHTLLIMPTSLITNWTKEFAKWTPGMRVKEFHGTSKAERTRNLEKVQRRGGVIITTYTMLLNNWQQLSSYNGREFTWDYMILDEAHKIKSSSTKTAKSASAIPSKNRVLLTGTPVQNNLKEMWALFDFACQGTLLGTAKTFKSEYENPITRAREKDATPGEKVLGSRMSEALMAIIKPYFLRRTKAEVQKNKTHPNKEEISDDKDSQDLHSSNDSGAVMPSLTRKNDLIVWTYLSSAQEDIYRQFISLDHIKELLMTTRSPLAELTILKKLCDHPRLLSAAAISKLGLEENTPESQQIDDTDTNSIANIPDDTLISESGKLVFLFALLEQLRKEGHRTLVFAHYRKVLDIIERVLGNRGFKVLRLDGTITQIAERQRLITLFQTDKRYSVFLLTTQVGGVGITLTAANRVVIYDPSWNPATDAQAVDRAYRIGQTENVVIYRLITCGTVEEKIYRRQVFKDSLIRQNTGDKKNPFRYFSKQELKELFTLENTHSSTTQLQLQTMHARHRRTDPELDEHIAHLHSMEMFGISDHDLMFSLDINNDEAPEGEEAHYIEGRVQKAQELMKAESELQMQLAENMASSTEPVWLRQPVDSNRERSQEKKTRHPRPSPPFPQNHRNCNSSPVVVELDQSSSGKEDTPKSPLDRVIDLTADESMSEQPAEEFGKDDVPHRDLDSSNHQPVKQERSHVDMADDVPLMVTEESLVMSEPTEAQTSPVEEQMDQSMITEAAGDASLHYVTAVDEDEQLNKTSNSRDNSEMDLGLSRVTPLQNKRLSILQASKTSFKADTSSRVSAGLESFEGNFNLQLEDSDVISDQEVLDPPETEEEEKKLLSQLRMEGSFDVDKSLSEKQNKETLVQSLSNTRASVVDESMNDSVVFTKKKRAAMIYDSDDEEEGGDNGQEEKCHFESSFHVLEASTPKSVPNSFTPLRSRKSVGGNTSVASRKSLLQSLIEDMDDPNADMEEDNVSVSGSDEADEEEIVGSTHDQLQLEETVGETNTEEEEEEEDVEEDIIGLTHDELQLEETVGETLNTEGEEEEELMEEEEMQEEEEEENSESTEEMSSSLEESTDDPELASSERIDQCTLDSGGKTGEAKDIIVCENESYESLVSRGKENYNKGKLDDALGFFLRAIDIKPGDPEIQLMTIQLYRQLSQRS